MTTKVTYADKVRKGTPGALLGVTDTFRASDANEIKTALNNNADILETAASTAEILLANASPLAISITKSLADIQEVVAVNTNVSNVLAWTIKLNGVSTTVYSQIVKRNNITLSSSTSIRNFADQFVAPTSPATITWTVEAVHSTNHAILDSASISVAYVYPSFVGLTTMSTITAYIVLNMHKVLSVSKNASLSGFAMSKQYFVYAYPAAYGAITSIKDKNGLEFIDSFVSSLLTINGISYYVYRLIDPVTMSNCSFTFA